MSVAVEDRVVVFTSRASDLIRQYDIRRSKGAQYLDGQRIAELFTRELVKIYDARIGIDANIFIRDWAIKCHLRCDRIPEMELKNGKEVKSPYAASIKRVYERLSFKKYTDILEEILMPRRRPLRGRTPVTHL